MKYTNGYSSKSIREKWSHLSSYHVVKLWLLNVRQGSFFIFSAGDSKELVTVWANI